MPMRRPKQPQLTEGPILRTLFRLAWPIMLSNFAQTLYNLIDALWLGRLGKEALAAPTLAWPIISLMISIGAGLGVAGTALVAQYTGAKAHGEAEHAAGQAFLFLLAAGVLLGLGGFLATGPILRLMGPEPEVFLLAKGYMQIIFASLPTMFLFFAFNALLQGWGDTMTPMKLSFASVGLNILLDPLLIFGFGPFPRWEVAGAAAATALSRGLLAGYAAWLLFSGRVGIQLRLRALVPELRMLLKLVRIGLPASVGQSGTALGFSVLMGIVARFGTATIGAFGIGQRVIGLAMMPAIGLGQATTTMVGQNLGGEEPQRAETTAWAGLGAIFAILAAAGILAFALRHEFVRAFIADPEVIAHGAELFQIVALTLPFVGALQVIIGAYQGAGKTMYSMFFSLFRLWGLRIPLAYWLGEGLGWGSRGIWWAMNLSNLGAALLAFGFFLTGNWKERLIRKPVPMTSAEAHALDPGPSPGEEA